MRVRYEAALGPVLPGMVIDHRCLNRAGSNPAHMEAVTRAENLRRGVVAKLTPAQVNEIRALKGSGLTHREIGLRFDVSQAHTTNILNGKYWSDGPRSEEHTSELQSLMRSSYAVFCFKKKLRKIYC